MYAPLQYYCGRTFGQWGQGLCKWKVWASCGWFRLVVVSSMTIEATASEHLVEVELDETNIPEASLSEPLESHTVPAHQY